MNVNENSEFAVMATANIAQNANETDVSEVHRTNPAQQQPQSEAPMSQKRFAKHGKGRNAVRIPIFKKSEAYPYFRIAYYESGKRVVRSFRTYSEALGAAEDKAEALATKGRAPELRDGQVSDAKSAFEVLEDYYQATGKRVSLLVLAKEYAAAMRKLGDKPLSEAVTTYLATSASIKRVPLATAVEAFLAAREPLTKAKPGERAQLSPKHFGNVRLALREFARTFPGTDLCDLNGDLVGAYFRKLAAFSPQTRNHRRASIKQFLAWAVRQDFLSGTHKLGYADSMTPERANLAETLFYTADEFRTLLTSADRDLLPMLAVGGLAGLRTQEMLRLTWEDVWRVPGHIEVTAMKAKTRQRRLVEVCASLASWLNPYREMTTGPVWKLAEIDFQAQFLALCESVGMKRKTNGLRHAFCSFHYALHGNENQTAAQAGNSPSKLHEHYKGLAVKTEAEKWFNVAPAQAGNVVSMAAAAKA